jgi:hypothetical protein
MSLSHGREKRSPTGRGRRSCRREEASGAAVGGSQRWAWWMKDRHRRWVCQPEVEARAAAEALEAGVAARVVIDGNQCRLGRGGG